MKAAFWIFGLFIVVALICVSNGNEENDLVLNSWLKEYKKPSANVQIRPKREGRFRVCGHFFKMMMREVCEPCVKPRSNMTRQEIRTFVTGCCLDGCTSKDARSFCCQDQP